ncbi:alpha/beta fold hydrolase [Pelomicrobium methylotrophicum]|uniref:Alpha/beta hydrolase n=1 Tax=Pelomicrobium methylotrophicum TaxID=2602750 RepID=A0A5C7F002_9PROT|nr:alpha/beta hydrolase [Pelomicrobium methylotrophicum]TXF13005.1 alpha/beta hydrolase [Pelomicrobium methylotrophicum]
MTPRHGRLLCLDPHGFHRVAYTEWGDRSNPHVVVCVHGLTRNRRDFDFLAMALAEHCRVVCMDVVGRGDSDWLEHKEDYGFPLYLSDAAALIAHLTAPVPEDWWTLPRRLFSRSNATRLDWIGTSMGGLIGMMLAARARTPIRRLVLNDVGPLVPWAGLARLKGIHAGLYTKFRDLEEVEAHLRAVCATFGPLDDAKWRHVARHSARRLEDGSYVLACDPGIVGSLRSSATDGIEFGTDFLMGVDLWPVWEAVRCPVLVLRGAESDLLLASTAQEMTRRGPQARVVEFPGIGHAPWLMTDEQIGVVREFLLDKD